MGGGSQYREIPRNFVDSSTAGPADRDRGGLLAAAAGGDGAQHEGRDRGPGPARLRQPRVPLRLAQTRPSQCPSQDRRQQVYLFIVIMFLHP